MSQPDDRKERARALLEWDSLPVGCFLMTVVALLPLTWVQLSHHDHSTGDLAVSLVVIGFAAIIVAVFVRWIVGPVLRCAQVAKRFADGNSTARMSNEDGPREVRFLAEVFNEAVERIHMREVEFDLMAAATGDAVWDLVPATGELVWRSDTTPVFGFAASEIPQHLSWWKDRLHPEDRHRVVTSLHDAIDGDAASWSEEYRLLRSDNEYRVFWDRGTIRRDETGRALRMLGCITDVTDRKEAAYNLIVRSRELTERVKELRCLHAIAMACSRDDRDVHSVLGDVVYALPSAMQRSEVAVARVVLGGHEVRSPDWRHPGLRISRDVEVLGRPAGMVEVGYVAGSEDGEAPFLEEERALIGTVGHILAQMVDRRESRRRLIEQTKQEALIEFRASRRA